LARVLRKQFYVHKLQRKYLLVGAILLLAFTVILLLSMFLPPALILMSDAALSAKKEAANQVIALADHLWPAFTISFILSLILGFFLTHRLAGPLYRFEQTIKAILSSDLSVRIRLRETDEFQEIALLLNEAIIEMDHRLRAIEAKGCQLEEQLDKILAELKQRPQGQVIAEELDRIQGLHSELMVLIQRFRLSSQPPDPAIPVGLQKK
jgi:methyl-accepting chemotaxis protein